MAYSSMLQHDHEFTLSHHRHFSLPSHLSPPPHSTIPDFSAPRDHASRSSGRTNAPHAADRQVAISAEEQHFSHNQALAQGQYPISTPSAHQGMTGNAGQPENMYLHPSTTGVMYPSIPYFEDHANNYNNFQDSYNNPTQANADFGISAMLGSGSSSYSQPSYTPRNLNYDSHQPLQNTTIIPSPPVDIGLRTESNQYTLSSRSDFESQGHMLRQLNSINNTFPVDLPSRIELDPSMPLPPSAFRSQSHMQQQRIPPGYSLPADLYSRIGSSTPMSHLPSAFESSSHGSHSDINHHLVTQTRQVHPESSSSRQTSHSHPNTTCCWLSEDNQLCDFEGSLNELKVHIRSTHSSGPPDARVECQWEGCRHRGRGDFTDRTMRHDSIWRHVQEKHLNIKYRKKR